MLDDLEKMFDEEFDVEEFVRVLEKLEGEGIVLQDQIQDKKAKTKIVDKDSSL